MVKKLAAYFFISTAILVLMAHAVIPHHHHETVAICFKKDHLKNDIFNHQANGKSHQHDDCNKPESCSFTEYITNLNDYNDKPVNSQVIAENHNQLQYFLNGAEVFDFFNPTAKDAIYLPYSSPQYSSILNFTSGLRAPPVV